MSKPDEAAVSAALPPITRPNGKVYRPRKIVAQHLGTHGDPDDFIGVVVFGTHDIDRAKVLADALVARDAHPDCEAAKPSLVWWGESMSYGDRIWTVDPEHGRAAVCFAEIVDKPREAKGD